MYSCKVCFIKTTKPEQRNGERLNKQTDLGSHRLTESTLTWLQMEQ